MTVLKTSLRSFFSHKGRMLLSGMAVVLSVAFVCGTLVFTATMNTTFDRLFAETASNVMLAPAEDEDRSAFEDNPTSGVPDTVPATVAGEVAAVEGVERVTGTVASTSPVAVDPETNENIGPTTGAPTVVTNWSDVELRSMEIAEGEVPGGPGEVMLDGDTAEDSGLGVGDRLRLITVFGTHDATITGIADFLVTNPGAAIVYTDLATAQEILLGGEEAFTTVYVDSTGAVTDEALRDAVAAVVGADTYKLQTAAEYIEENRDEIGEILSIMEYVLLGFAGVSLLVGIFLIVNTFSMLVAQRTREIGLMRAIGANRRQINRSVLTEALLLGLLGSAAGFAAGIGLAVGLMRLMSLLGMNLSTSDLTVEWSVPVTGLVLGVIVTLLAAYIPARRAGRISPMAALSDAGMPGDVRAGRVRAAVGASLTLAGLAALAGTASAEDAAGGSGLLGLGVVASLVGLILVGPALVGLVVRGIAAVLLRIFGPVGRLAERNALRNPRRTGATASALMIGLALVAGLSVVGSSMVASATQEIDESLGADYIVQTANFLPILPEAAQAVDGVEGLARVTPFTEAEADVTTPDGAAHEVRLGAAPADYATDIQLDVLEGDVADAFADGGISVDDAFAEDEGVGVGDELTVAFADGETATLTIGAVVSGDSAFYPAWYVSQDTLEANVPAEALPLPLMLLATAEDGRQDQARAALDAAMEPFPQMEVRDQSEFKELIQDQVGQLLYMVYGLLALAIVVAILGVVNTLALSVVERTREIGLMRAIGLSRRQLRRMIRLESVAIALFGAVLGLALGLAWGAAGQRLLALEGMPVLEIPWPTLISVFVGAALVGLLAALIPAFRAGRMNILTAIATD
ncbi:FtsX-like permease family protein [Streptomyces sp. DSM 44917]|uniref:FtsX-like permease family protein n=1 Tax=Streptomyces boetiae TaxID=3075541 RepID=A0ABU2LG52_9ACTN|nr:FtsX-like permease family protein [Streptomyces sp. DSM 44917]MDT0310496.1 FtsX-like permease family protein [Streptomyces sp. DSM 44917]